MGLCKEGKLSFADVSLIVHITCSPTASSVSTRAASRLRPQGAGERKEVLWVTSGLDTLAIDGWTNDRGVAGTGLENGAGANLGKLAVGPAE